MPRLPAACAACEIVYPSPLQAERPGSDVAFAVPVPCPACGEGGRVPAEVLRRLLEAVRVLRGLGEEAGELEGELEAAAGACREADTREEAVLDVLRRVPGVGRLAGLLPGETPGQMAVFTRVIGALARELERPGGGEGEAAPGEEDPPGEAPVEGAEADLEVVSRALEGLYEGDAPPASGPPEEDPARARLREAGRNDPCPCGSGDKYKDCHWVEDQRSTRV